MELMNVDNKIILNALQLHKENEIVHVVDEDKDYQWTGDEWVEYEKPKFMEIAIPMRDIIINYSPIDWTNYEEDFLKWQGKTNHFLLWCPELSCITIFEESKNEFAGEDLMTALKETIACIGNAVYIDDFNTVGNPITIWVKLHEGELNAFCLAHYDMGVIYYD